MSFTKQMGAVCDGVLFVGAYSSRLSPTGDRVLSVKIQ